MLGNAANRSRFRKTFWWDEDVGLSTYLAEAAGTPQLIEETDHETGTQATRRPRIVLEEDPPRSHGDALQRWQKARAAFRAALQKSHKNLQELAKVRKLDLSLPTLEREETVATAAAANALEAEALRHNLGVLMNIFGGGSFPTAEKRALIPDLWASLFLVVPLVSTTFASVDRMLRDLPVETLGWLFVDEAGQALPQAAVGALMRARRAVIVGDPMQIEPVVTLPDSLTHAICQQFGVDPDRYNAPNASVQTLADAATPYVAEFESRHGSRTVGVPLLVHRRCAEPMFGISNAVAYGRLMVNAKPTALSKIGDVLGPSTWIDVQGSAQEKWCPEEGEMVLLILRRLAQERGLVPELYIVTPFVVVAHNLRKLVQSSDILADWTDDSRRWTTERIGTVHTVQGREAEAVLFVLGATAPHQAGARSWAGGKPNLLNVAVTRAKERLYVIGNRSLWREAGVFRELDARLPPLQS